MMFFHNFKYVLKTLIKDRALIFWTFAFPIILGFLFYLAFSEIESGERFQAIDLAVVDDSEFQAQPLFVESLKQLGKGKDRILRITYASREEAKALLEAGDVAGMLHLEKGEPVVTVASSGINETILKSVMDEVLQRGELIAKGAYEWDETVEIKDVSRGNLSYVMIEFYTLIAMTCLYGGVIGMTAINRCMANASMTGRRLGISPARKSHVILSALGAGFVIQLVGCALVFLFTIFVFDVDYGEKLPLVLLLAVVGCLAGLSIGIAVGTLIKAGENAKLGIIIAYTMAGCFFSGMMGITMKYYVDVHAPLINRINPAAMITDGFYALYYYEGTSRYMGDLVGLLLFSGILILLSLGSLRRVRYDHI